MRDNYFLRGVYLDRNVHIFHGKSNCHNFFKRMYFFSYRLFILIVPETWYLPSHLVSFFYASSYL